MNPPVPKSTQCCPCCPNLLSFKIKHKEMSGTETCMEESGLVSAGGRKGKVQVRCMRIHCSTVRKNQNQI